VEARNLAPLPADVDYTVAAALPISGLTAWQGLIEHARLTTGQTVLIHGAACGVGSIAVQLARDVGALVIGTGRAADRDTAIGLGVDAFLDLQADKLGDAGEVDLVFDVIGGEILDRSTALVRAGGTLVTIARVPTVSRTSSSGSGTDGSDRSSGRYARSPKRLPRSPPTGTLWARRSSGSPKANSRLGGWAGARLPTSSWAPSVPHASAATHAFASKRATSDPAQTCGSDEEHSAQRAI